MDLASTTRLIKALGDEARLRLLHLCSLGELSVSEMMEILNMGQSRVSTQLTLLKEVGLLQDRRLGRRSLYSLGPAAKGEPVDSLLAGHSETIEFRDDVAGWEALLQRKEQESKSYFDRVASTFGEQELPGRTWEGLARALLHLAPRARYVDLGIGDGLLTLMLAEVAAQVTAVDLSPEMLSQLQLRAQKRGFSNIRYVEGRIEALPLDDAQFDVAVLSQALHHTDDPQTTLEEARRVLVPGGALIVIDLLAHNEDWVRERLQHRLLGFTEPDLEQRLQQAGFDHVRVSRVARDPSPPHFMTLLATGIASAVP
ncbi:MAG: metalloregulator ArsR/SmtB family transcription factor, partial [Planctomycetes bacterium]|nr:metalloregulator ArsR/SmtB family transcription factor [Planctomycetota bacterium]